MSTHHALIARLCEASEGSADLSREVWEAMTGKDIACTLCAAILAAEGER